MKSLPRRLAAPAVIALVALLALGANPLAGTTTGPFDLLTSWPGWGNSAWSEIRHTERSDVLDWQLPQWQWAKNQWREGESLIWNWSRGGGIPGIFDVSTAMATPGFWLYALTPDDALGFYLAILSRLLLAGFGMYLLLRIELGQVPSLFGAITFMLSGFFAAWLFWPQTASLMWLPWLIFVLYRYLQQPDLLRWLLLVGITWLLLLGGFPSVTAYCLYASVIGLFIYGVTQRWSVVAHIRWGAFVGAAFVLAITLAAPWLAGLAEVLQHVDVSYRSSGSPWSLADTLLSLLPNHAFENPRVEQARYVGTLALLLSGGALALLGRRSPSVLFTALGAVLAIISIVLVGGVVPSKWLAWVPALNNSSWGRVASILGFALALLAAVGCAALLNALANQRRRWIIAFGVLLIGIQSADQLSYFRAFNGPVDSALMYPKSDAVSFLQNNSMVLQNTIIDRSFGFPGTANYFGINEWFAHGFKAQHELEVLQSLGTDLYSSRTSSYFLLDQINLGEPALTALGVRYLAGQTRAVATDHADFGVTGHAPAPPMPTAGWRQQLQLTEPLTLVGIELLLATYGAEHAPDDVVLQLFNGTAKSPQQPELARSRLAAEEITDNRWVHFRFSEALLLQPGAYNFVVSLSDYKGPKQLTAWSGSASERAFLNVNGKASGRSVKFRLTTVLPQVFPVHYFARDVAVFENPAVTSNAYFIPALDTAPEKIVYSGDASVRTGSNQRLEIDYSGDRDGWVVVPVRQLPGWHASRNGEPLKADTYLGMLPAFPVQGASTINYHYNSNLLRVGRVAAYVGLSVVLVLLLGSFTFLRSAARPRRLATDRHQP